MNVSSVEAPEDATFKAVVDSADRENWLAQRQTGIGSSDASTVLGVNPWKTPLQLYAEKIGIEEPADENEAMYWGSVLEPLVLKRFAKETGRACRPAGLLLRSKVNPWQIATLDGLQAEDRGPGVLEVKCTSLADRWDDGPPPYVVAQVQHQLAVTGYQWGSVAVLFNGREFFWMDFERDEPMIGEIIRIEGEFWRRIESLDPPDPEGSEADRKIIGKLFPKDIDPSPVVLDGTFIDLDERRAYLKERAKELDAELLSIDNRLKMEIGEHSEALLPSGVRYSLKLQHRKESVIPASSFRVLRRSERKGK